MDAIGVPRRTTFKWRALTLANKYELQIATDNQVDSLGVFKSGNVVFDTVLTDTSLLLSTPLNSNTTFYWHVSAMDTAGSSGYSNTLKFTTGTAITAVNEPANGIPKKFALFQNYPNPFNPTTMIEYNLSKAQMVTLKVYNVLGQEIVTLVNNQQDAGYYRVNFNAEDLTSGVYFYILRTSNFMSIHKMLLLK
jgi:hypothetical protein